MTVVGPGAAAKGPSRTRRARCAREGCTANLQHPGDNVSGSQGRQFANQPMTRAAATGRQAGNCGLSEGCPPSVLSSLFSEGRKEEKESKNERNESRDVEWLEVSYVRRESSSSKTVLGHAVWSKTVSVRQEQ